MNLGKLTKIGISVPPGFVILAPAFERFLEKTDINAEIKAIWDRINIRNIESVKKNSEIIRNLILNERMPNDIEKEILEGFAKLKTKYVAVRSSATAEDSKMDSWAGELETYLNTIKEKLSGNVKKCWASLYTPRALFYRIKRNLKGKKVSVAVVVQKMIQSEFSGACFTVHPVVKNKNQMVIEVVKGLGEKLMQGKIIPDSYVIDKTNLNALDMNISPWEKRKLSKKEIQELAKLCIKIEKHYKKPQDIEWALKKNKFYIVQTRPITAL